MGHPGLSTGRALGARGGLTLAVLSLVAAGCGSTGTPSGAATGRPSPAQPANPAGDIPDTQAYVTFRIPSGQFSVKVPEGWAETQKGGAVTFTDKLNRVTLLAVPAASAPTPASAGSAEVPSIKSAEPNFRLDQVMAVQTAAGPAVLISYQSDAPPDPVTGKVIRDSALRFEFWKGGTEAVLVLAGPVGSDNVDPWRLITESFRWAS